MTELRPSVPLGVALRVAASGGRGDATALAAVAARYPVRVPPGYLALARTDDPADPIARLCLPDEGELAAAPGLVPDPLAEERLSPVPGVVHRYPDRALWLVTERCPVYCRFCTRKRLVGREATGFDLDAAVAWLRATPAVSEVILSGGDPLMLSDRRLEAILRAVRAVPSVAVVRVHTRVPAALPSRVTPRLARLLARFHPLWLNTHFDHPRELTPEAVAACGRLADVGIPLGNQCVLLRGVNDDRDVQLALCRALVQARVRPYYLHQCDLTEGVEHFRTPLARGLEILAYLRGRLSGTAIPTFVVDLPGGLGKVPLTPDYVVRREAGRTVLRAPGAGEVAYPEPVGDDIGPTPVRSPEAD